MQAILLNDTRFDRHVGCDLVIATIIGELIRRGVVISCAFTQIPELEQAPQTPEFQEAGLVVLNGEGSMHHDAPRNLAMLRLCEQAHAAGKRTALINSVWQDNVTSNDYLQFFDVVSLRDRRSWEASRLHRADASWVPDLTLVSGFFEGRAWPSEFKQEFAHGVPVLVVDSVVKPVHRQLAELALAGGWPFVPMGNYGKSLLDQQMELQTALQARGLDCRPDNGTLRLLFEHGGAIITGRFHAVCLALLARKPFLAIASNTHKIESLIEEIGLDSRVLLQADEITLPEVTQRLPWLHEYFQASETREKVASYLHAAVSQTATLFDRVVEARSAGAAESLR